AALEGPLDGAEVAGIVARRREHAVDGVAEAVPLRVEAEAARRRRLGDGGVPLEVLGHARGAERVEGGVALDEQAAAPRRGPLAVAPTDVGDRVPAEAVDAHLRDPGADRAGDQAGDLGIGVVRPRAPRGGGPGAGREEVDARGPARAGAVEAVERRLR